MVFKRIGEPFGLVNGIFQDSLCRGKNYGEKRPDKHMRKSSATGGEKRHPALRREVQEQRRDVAPHLAISPDVFQRERRGLWPLPRAEVGEAGFVN